MSQQHHSPSLHGCVHKLSGHFTVLAALLLTIAAPYAYSQTACNVVYTISPQNSTAFGGAITLENTGTTAWTSWTLTWTFANGQTVSSLWNGVETQSGANVTVKNESYNGSLAAGGSLSGIGFNGTWNGTTNAVPASFAVNGTTCGGAATGSFKLTPSASTLSIAQGGSSTDTITVADVSPFNGSVAFTASGQPAGVTVTFNPTSSATSSVATFAVASTTVAGSYPITIKGTSGTLSATATVTLTVTGGSCTPTAITPYISINGGSTWTEESAATVTSTTTAVDLGPQPTTGTWSWSGPNGFTSTARQINSIALSAGANVYVATYTNSSSCKSTQAFTITVTSTTSGFTLSPAASSLTIAQSASGTDTIAVKDTGTFTGSVAFAATGQPAGVTVTFNPTSSATSSVATFAATASAVAGSYPITITGTSGTLSATAAITLTVTGGTPANATVTVNQTSAGPTVTDQLLGMNMPAWYDVVTNRSTIIDAFQTAGIKSVRWPGGSWSDLYHWQTNTNCDVAPYGTTAGQPNSDDVFDNFVTNLAIPGGLDVALTANYGTNPTCNGGGEPSEAAAWAAAALTDGITVSHMTVGNEVYGSTWEEDLHSSPNNPSTYAAAVVGSSGYYSLIKAASPKTLVGVVVEADNSNGGWDNTVLANAKGSYDFVEYHYYPETPGQENDTTLIQQDAQQLTTNVNTIKSELEKWGTPNTPIYVGEIGGPYSDPGKQSWSITQGLYAGQVLGELMNDGVSRLTWWIGFENCNGQAGNDSSSVYGWQSFGAYNVFSDGSADPTCPNAGPAGTLSPTARAFQLFSAVAVNGESVLNASVTGDTTDVVAYAATSSGGTALVLFNRNENSSETVAINLSAQTSAKTVTVETYDKAIYDESNPATTNTWAPPINSTITSPTLPLTLTLAPWSMNVVIIH